MNQCPFCDSPKVNIVNKDVMGEYSTWDCGCGAHGLVKNGVLYPRVEDEKRDWVRRLQ